MGLRADLLKGTVMASIIKEVELPTRPDVAWAMLRDVGAADKAFPGVLVSSCLEDGVRTVNFANGMKARERIINIDDDHRRSAYSVIEGRFSHHHASMQILPGTEGGSRFLWISDFLPDEAEPLVRGLVDQGAAAFQQALRGRE